MIPKIMPALLLLSAPVAASQWELVPEESSVTFTYIAQGRADSAGFADFSADIRFDPDDLDAAEVVATVALGSLRDLASDRQRYLASDAFFNSSTFPKATFRSDTFERLGDDRYRASGSLAIKGQRMNVEFPFKLKISGDRAVMDGRFSIDRTAFGIGSGQWSDPKSIAHKVDVKVHFIATR